MGRVEAAMRRFGTEEGERITSRILTRSIERSQRRLWQEQRTMRSRYYEFDDVLDAQRQALYGFRDELLRAESPRAWVLGIMEEVADARIDERLPAGGRVDAQTGGELVEWVQRTFSAGLSRERIVGRRREDACGVVHEVVRTGLDARIASFEAQCRRYIVIGDGATRGPDGAEMDQVAVNWMARVIHSGWKWQIEKVARSRQDLGQRTASLEDLLAEFEREASETFAAMMSEIKRRIAATGYLWDPEGAAHRAPASGASVAPELPGTGGGATGRAPVERGAGAGSVGQEREREPVGVREVPGPRPEPQRRAPSVPGPPVPQGVQAPEPRKPVVAPAIGRNDPCPCGSGKKFKVCHGAGGLRSVDLGGGVSLELVWIPPGEFLMGSPASELGRSLDEDLHAVRLTSGFWMGKYPVTQGQWEDVLGTNPSDRETLGRDVPVNGVSWDAAQAFLAQLVSRTRWRFRLPTEAQWEYACRAGTTTRFHTGDADSDLSHAGWNYHWPSFVPVGTGKMNAWGLCNMHGAVSQWCSDWYGGYPRGPVADPAGAEHGTLRVLRGGSRYYGAENCRSARRLKEEPRHTWHCGLRVVAPPMV
jgi:formylglycine-generating enzyme required for sulfatase activity